MTDIRELEDDLLVEEGHYLERIQSEALEESWVHSTLRDFESILKEYGPEYTIRLLSSGSKETLHRSLVSQ